jgi:hypothetical protein
MTWNKVVVHVDNFPVSIYINEDSSRAVIFPLFGKYYGLSSDQCALTLAISFMFQRLRQDMTYTQYLTSQEDTNPLYQEAS